MDKRAFGKCIKNHREEMNMTQKELADALCVDATTVSAWERGKSYPDLEMTRSLCEVLCITVEQSFAEADQIQLTGRVSINRIAMLIVAILMTGSMIGLGVIKLLSGSNLVAGNDPIPVLPLETTLATEEETTTSEITEEDSTFLAETDATEIKSVWTFYNLDVLRYDYQEGITSYDLIGEEGAELTAPCSSYQHSVTTEKVYENLDIDGDGLLDRIELLHVVEDYPEAPDDYYCLAVFLAWEGNSSPYRLVYLSDKLWLQPTQKPNRLIQHKIHVLRNSDEARPGYHFIIERISTYWTNDVNASDSFCAVEYVEFALYEEADSFIHLDHWLGVDYYDEEQPPEGYMGKERAELYYDNQLRNRLERGEEVINISFD